MTQLLIFGLGANIWQNTSKLCGPLFGAEVNIRSSASYHPPMAVFAQHFLKFLSLLGLCCQVAGMVGYLVIEDLDMHGPPADGCHANNV